MIDELEPNPDVYMGPVLDGPLEGQVYTGQHGRMRVTFMPETAVGRNPEERVCPVNHCTLWYRYQFGVWRLSKGSKAVWLEFLEKRDGL